ncbi:MAG: sulfatase-like hydrolase/transferase, partial [Myxococcales bacterium]|nr:sulfatase-like hydrolase/transferase [Myxococcales bacterium]
MALRALLGGALPGAVAYFGLFGLCLAAHARAEYLGVEDDALANKVVTLFHDELVAHQLGLLAIYLAIGAVVGLGAFAYVELARHVARRPYHRWRQLFWTLVGILVVHSWFVVRSIARHPAVYEPQVHNSLYLGVLFWLAVDVLPRWLIDALGVVTALSTTWFALVLVARRARARAPRATASASAAVLGLAVGAVTALTHTAAVAPPSRPNILILAVDSLRDDMLDHDPAITPRINALARAGVRFDDAFSVMPRTFPSWASILTGLYPHHHGVRHMFPPPVGGPTLDGSLPKILARAGYRTAVISDFAGDPFTRGDFGFQHVDAPEFTLRSNVRLGSLKVHMHLLPYLIDVFGGEGFPELQAFERLGEPRWLTRKAVDWVADPDTRPFFLVVFYSAGHFPFASAAPYYDRYVDPGYRGRSRFHKAVVGQPLEGAARKLEEDHIRGLYEGAIASSDAAIGELLDALEERGRLSDTIVVVT